MGQLVELVWVRSVPSLVLTAKASTVCNDLLLVSTVLLYTHEA